MADKRGNGKISYIETAYNDVPEIGTVYKRWYDLPYSILRWLLSGKVARYTPEWTKDRIRRYINALHQYNVHDRHKAWSLEDPTNNINPPEDEHFTMPSIFAIELFTPNEADALRKSIIQNKWNSRAYAHRESNSERLERARLRHGLSWWNLADIVDDSASFYIPDALMRDLPDEFSRIKLRAVQIGSGTTAVVAQFTLKDDYTSSLDQILHSSHEPFLDRSIKGKLYPMNRLFSAYKNTQEKRNSLHKAARTWMSENCRGYFSTHNEKQVSMDMLLSTNFDPVEKRPKPIERDLSDALRAVGFDSFDSYRMVAPELPDLALYQADTLSKPYIYTERTWGLMGNIKRLKKSTNNFKYYGGDPLWGVTAMAGERIGHTLVLLSISELLSILEAQSAKLRDTAGLQHRKFKIKNINNLNSIILDSSLTLASIKHDIKSLSKQHWWFDKADFTITPSPYLSTGIKREAVSLIDNLLGEQAASIDRLEQTDADYRNILTTVSSLGSGTSSIKLSRLALAVSMVSLLIAAYALFTGRQTPSQLPVDSGTASVSENRYELDYIVIKLPKY